MNIFKKFKQLRYLNNDITIANQEINDLEIKIDTLSDILSNKHSLYEQIKEDWILQQNQNRSTQQEIDEINQKRVLNGINHLTNVYETNKQNNQELIDDNQKLLKENQFLKQYKLSLKSSLDSFDKEFPSAVNYDRLAVMLNEITPDKDFALTLHLIDNLTFDASESYEIKQLIEQTKIEIKQLFNNYRTNYIDNQYYSIYHLLILGIQDAFQFILKTSQLASLGETKTEVQNMLKQYFSIAVKGNETNLLPIFTPLLFKIEPLYLKLVTLEYQYQNNETEVNTFVNEKQNNTNTKMIRKKKVVQPMPKFNQVNVNNNVNYNNYENDKLIKLRHQ